MRARCQRKIRSSGAAMKQVSVVGAALFLILQFAAAQRPSEIRGKISHDLVHANTSDTVDVIVQYKNIPNDANYRHATRLGAATKAQMHFIRAAAFRVPSSSLTRLAADPEVVYISPDRPLQSFLSNAAPAINAPYAWSFGYHGSGI